LTAHRGPEVATRGLEAPGLGHRELESENFGVVRRGPGSRKRSGRRRGIGRAASPWKPLPRQAAPFLPTWAARAASRTLLEPGIQAASPARPAPPFPRRAPRLRFRPRRGLGRASRKGGARGERGMGRPSAANEGGGRARGGGGRAGVEGTCPSGFPPAPPRAKRGWGRRESFK